MTTRTFVATCACLLAGGGTTSAQTDELQAALATVRVRAVVVDKDLNQKPVPFLALTITAIDGRAVAVEVQTALDGTTDASLPPGEYAVRSLAPLEFQGTAYRWDVPVTVGRADVVVELTNANASTTTTGPVTGSPGTETLSALFERLKNSVVTIYSEFGQGSGFLIDPSGLVLTNAHVVDRSEYLAAQFDDRRKVRVTLLASDLQKDLAVLLVNPEAFPEAAVAPLGSTVTTTVGQTAFTVGNPLDTQRVLTSGVISRVEPTRLVSDINTNPGNSGGPLFNAAGEVVGVTTFVAEGTAGPGLSGIIRIEEALPLVDQARARQADTVVPSSALLAVMPLDPFPVEALRALSVAENVKPGPYGFSVGDYEVMILTPPFAYRLDASEHLRLQKGQQKRAAQRGATTDATKPWELAAERGDFKPATVIRVIPKTKEKFWASFGATMASPGNTRVSIREFKTDFHRMRLLCGGVEVEPIIPGRMPVGFDDTEGTVQITDTTSVGVYSYLPSAVRPDCGTVTLEIFADTDVPPVTKVLGAATVAAVWNDYAAYRKATGIQ